MAGMKDLSTAFAQAAGPHVSLRGQRMRYDSERNHVLEFDAVCGERGDQGFVEKLTSTASMVDLTAAAIRLGTRARELAHGGEQLVMKTPVDHAVERIKSGEFELVDDGQPEPKPALFFLNKTQGPTMSKHVGTRVADAANTIKKKVGAATDALIAKVNTVGDDAVKKLGQVETTIVDPLLELISQLDEITFSFGDNGPPADVAPLTVAGEAAVSKPGAATAAMSRPSTLGKAVPVPDYVKQP